MWIAVIGIFRCCYGAYSWYMRREAVLVGCNGRLIRRKSIRERQRCSSAGGLVAVVQDEYAWWSVLRLRPAAAEAGSAADIQTVGQWAGQHLSTSARWDTGTHARGCI